MTDKTLTYQDVREIIKLVEEADKFGEFRLRYNDIEISLSKHAPLSDVATQAQRSAPLPSLPLRAEPAPQAAISAPAAASNMAAASAANAARNGPPIS